MTRVRVGAGGAQANEQRRVDLDDGRTIAFASRRRTSRRPTAPKPRHVRPRPDAQTTTLASTGSAATDSSWPRRSARDGRFVTFTSTGTLGSRPRPSPGTRTCSCATAARRPAPGQRHRRRPSTPAAAPAATTTPVLRGAGGRVVSDDGSRVVFYTLVRSTGRHQRLRRRVPARPGGGRHAARVGRGRGQVLAPEAAGNSVPRSAPAISGNGRLVASPWRPRPMTWRDRRHPSAPLPARHAERPPARSTFPGPASSAPVPRRQRPAVALVDATRTARSRRSAARSPSTPVELPGHREPAHDLPAARRPAHGPDQHPGRARPAVGHSGGGVGADRLDGPAEHERGPRRDAGPARPGGRAPLLDHALRAAAQPPRRLGASARRHQPRRRASPVTSLQELYAMPDRPAAVDALRLDQVGLASSPLRDISLAAFALGGTPLRDIPIDGPGNARQILTDWCNADREGRLELLVATGSTPPTAPRTSTPSSRSTSAASRCATSRCATSRSATSTSPSRPCGTSRCATSRSQGRRCGTSRCATSRWTARRCATSRCATSHCATSMPIRRRCGTSRCATSRCGTSTWSSTARWWTAPRPAARPWPTRPPPTRSGQARRSPTWPTCSARSRSATCTSTTTSRSASCCSSSRRARPSATC